MLFRALGILLLAAAAAAAELPIDLAYSRRQVTRFERPVLSSDGRYLAYEVRTPPVKNPDTDPDIEQPYLPTGLPSDKTGMRLWISDLRSGESRAVCVEAINCWRGSWSPNSRLLAFFSDEGGEIGLWIYDVASDRSRRIGDFVIKAKLWTGDQVSWSPDSKTIYAHLAPPAETKRAAETKPAELQTTPSVTVYRTREAAATAGVEAEDPTAALRAWYMEVNNSTLAAIDVASGALRVVVPHDAADPPNNLRLSPDGRWLSYIAVYRLPSAMSIEPLQDLVIVPAAGGAPVATFRDLKMPQSDYFGLSYRWTPDSRRIVYWKNNDLWVSDIPPRADPRRIGESLGAIAEEPFLLTEDGKSVLVGLEPEGEKSYYFVPARALAIVPLDGGTPKVVDVSGTPVPRDEFTVLQPAAGSFYLIRDVEGEAKREIVRVHADTAETKRVWIDQGRLNIVGAVAGSGQIVARFEGLATPPDYFLFDRDFRMIRRLSEGEPRLADVRVGPMEGFDTLLPGHDGAFKSVRTHVFLPAGAKKGDRLPAIVYFYSGSAYHRFAQDFGGGAPNSIPVQIFASRGYAVLFCDVPLGPQGEGGNPMQEMTEAVLAQVYRAAELGYTDRSRVGIMGQSYGGYSTAGIITETNLFRAAAALSGLYDLPAYYGTMDHEGTSFNFAWAESGQGRMGTHPWMDLRRYVQNSPYYQADKIRTPLLIIHGEKDSACPVEDAKKMFNALKRLDRQAELAIYAGEGHVPGEWSLVNAIDATERMLTFFDRHLRGVR